MLLTEIIIFGLKQAISQIGGLLSLFLSIYGILFSILLPFMFMKIASNYFLEKESKQKKNNKEDVDSMKSILKKIFSFEHFYQIN